MAQNACDSLTRVFNFDAKKKSTSASPGSFPTSHAIAATKAHTWCRYVSIVVVLELAANGCVVMRLLQTSKLYIQVRLGLVVQMVMKVSR
jgi:hypothetical protein